jgi:hypothetical protein
MTRLREGKSAPFAIAINCKQHERRRRRSRSPTFGGRQPGEMEAGSTATEAGKLNFSRPVSSEDPVGLFSLPKT